MALASTYKAPVQLPDSQPAIIPRSQPAWDSHRSNLRQWAQLLQDGSFNAASLGSGWSNFGNPYNPGGFRVDLTGRVWLRGLVTAASSTLPSTILTLPWSPQFKHVLHALAFNGASAYTPARIDVDTSGNVILIAIGTGTIGTGWVSLDGLSISLAP